MTECRRCLSSIGSSAPLFNRNSPDQRVDCWSGLVDVVGPQRNGSRPPETADLPLSHSVTGVVATEDFGGDLHLEVNCGEFVVFNESQIVQLFLRQGILVGRPCVVYDFHGNVVFGVDENSTGAIDGACFLGMELEQERTAVSAVDLLIIQPGAVHRVTPGLFFIPNANDSLSHGKNAGLCNRVSGF